jgi:tol-pal system protein YbgF
MKKYALLAGAVLLSGCVSGSDFQRLETQVNDLQDEIAELKRQASSKEEVQKLNATIVDQTDKLVRSNASMTAKVGELDEKVDNVQGGVEQTNYRVDRLVQQVTQIERDVADLQSSAVRGAAAPPTGVAPAVTAPTTTTTAPPLPGNEMTVTPATASSEDPLVVYQAAYKDYQRGNYDLAIEGFRDFVQNNGKSDLADNAAYWVGESLFSQKKYTEAIEQFNRVINGYPKSDKIPAALLKKGYAYIELGEKAQGVVQLQYVIHEHPNSQEASLARQKLKALGIETK